MRDDLTSKEEDKRLLELDKSVDVYKQHVDDIKNRNTHFSERLRLKESKKVSMITTLIGIFIMLMYIILGIGALIVAVRMMSRMQ